MKDDTTIKVPQETGAMIEHPIAAMRAGHDDHFEAVT